MEDLFNGIENAATTQPALYLFVILALYGLRLIVKANKETADSFLGYVVKQDERQDARDAAAQSRADSCHNAQNAAIERFIEHSKESDGRRDAALQKNAEAMTAAAAVIQSCATRNMGS